VSPRKRDQLIWVLGAAASAVLFSQTWVRFHRPGGIDLTTYLAAARAVRAGESPYSLPLPFPYIYPPVVAFAMIPLTLLPSDAVLVSWFAASLVAMVWALRRVLLAAHPALRGSDLTPFFAVLLVAMYPIVQSNLRNAQVNIFVIALAIAALGADHVARRGTSWAGAIAIKILPAGLAPYFVRRGEWGLIALTCIVLGALCIVPAIALGSSVIPITRAYVVSFLGGGFAGAAAALDFSLGGMVARFTGIDGRGVRLVCAALPLLIAFAIDTRTRPERQSDARMFALYLAVIPLASPKSEVHHVAFALPAAAAVLADVWFHLSRSLALRFLLAGAAVAYACALAAPPVWSGPLWFAALTMLAGCVVSGRYPGAAAPRG
jgi:hypothetical protein